MRARAVNGSSNRSCSNKRRASKLEYGKVVEKRTWSRRGREGGEGEGGGGGIRRRKIRREKKNNRPTKQLYQNMTLEGTIDLQT